ncbi:MAG: hypothetical protein JWN14_2819 [Chthonomonadales bacterium]|nr:hypothetical protein [Chthonomonadales bacterium]
MNTAYAFADCARIATRIATALIATATTLIAIGPASASDDPASSGVSRDRLLRIHELVEREIAEKEYSGVVTLVARDGHIVHFEAQGMADIEGGKLMTKDAVFRLASMSKVITAVAVLILGEEGKVRLTDPVERFLPEFKDLKVGVSDPGPSAPGAPPKVTRIPAAHAITVRELLTHSSGLGSGPISAAEMAKEPGKPGEDLAAEVARMARAPLDFQPGTRFAYSGLAGFDTLGRIVEVVSGMNLERFLTERIYRPLGMTGTTFAPSAAQRSRLVTLYSRTGGGLAKATNQDLLIDPVCFRGAGGLLGTAEDYWRFAQMLANGGELNGKRILSPRTVEMLGAAQLAEGFPGLPPGHGWGLGVRCITNGPAAATLLSTGTYGWSGAWGTHFWVDPTQKLVAIFMANETTTGGAGAVSARDFETAVMQSLTTLYRSR